MKNIFLTIFTVPVLPIIIGFIGYLSSIPKNKLRLYSLAITIFFFTSLPITSYVISYPLINLSDTFKNNDFSEAQSIIVLTGGVKKNIVGEWVPSHETVRRIEIAKKISQDYSLPIIISGGKTSNKNQSEASISKIYFDLTDIFMEQKSLNTYQSAINLRKYCSEGNGTMLLISGMYHTLRSFLTFKTNKCKIKVYKYNRKFTYDLFIPSLSGLSNFNQVIYELSGLFYYTITNKIKII